MSQEISEKTLDGFEPKILWQKFYEISQIARPSKKEERILRYLKTFAGSLDFKTKEDGVGNLVISVPPTPGHENARVVVLQSHVDMVCEKDKETEHDFDTEPIRLVRDGGWIQAEGTTLGSDNGIGVAASLAVALDREAIHGPLELLFTVDEETGLTGANNLQPGFITGKTLLNLDSEEHGSFYVGCSGGQDTIGVFTIEKTKALEGRLPHRVAIAGLRGGHSGLDIHAGRANAIKLLGRLLEKLATIDYQVVDIGGGSKRNAIPREAEATILLEPADTGSAGGIVREFSDQVSAEYEKNDAGLKIDFTPVDKPSEKVLSRDLVTKLVRVILALPHGVIAMSPDIPGLVETSTNLAIVGMGTEEIRIETSQRSSVESAKDYIVSSVASVFRLADGEVIFSGSYPGWKPNLDSEILEISRRVYKRLFKQEPEIKAVHAGLECGVLGDKYPGLDMVSFGPTIQGAHSPGERVCIEDVERFYKLLKGILSELAMRKEETSA